MKKLFICLLLVTICAFSSMAFACGSEDANGSVTVYAEDTVTCKVGSKVKIAEYEGKNKDTVKYFYINPYGDLKEVNMDLGLYFTATMEGKYVIRYLINDNWELSLKDTVVIAK